MIAGEVKALWTKATEAMSQIEGQAGAIHDATGETVNVIERIRATLTAREMAVKEQLEHGHNAKVG